MRMLALVIAVLAFGATSDMARAEQFVVVHVEPAVSDLAAGAVYESRLGSPEFLFVPSGVRAVLIGEDGTSYLVEGRVAVEASRAGLDEFRVGRKEDSGGLLHLVFGVAGLEDITAASRKLPGRARAADGEETDLAARLPLIAELVAKMGEGERFCLVADALVVRRLDARFLDRVHVGVDGRSFDEDLQPQQISVRFRGLGVDEDGQARIAVSTRLEAGEVDAVRLPDGALGGDVFGNVALLANRGCTIQAMLLAGGGTPD